MRRTLSTVFVLSVIFVTLACALIAPASSAQRKGARKPQPPPRGAGLGERQTAAVTVKNFEFRPKTLVVKPGTVVTWTNEAGAHTVTADDDSFSSPTLSAGQTFSHRFARKGTYRYHCTLHGSAGGHDMAGTVVVRP